jgi:hypothetical protein
MSGPRSDETLEKSAAGDQRHWADVPVIAVLPASLHAAEGGEEVLLRLAGARIVRIGAPAGREVEGGGLVLDYMLPGSSIEHRIIFAFTELGMWIRWDSLREEEDFIITDRVRNSDSTTALLSDQS